MKKSFLRIGTVSTDLEIRQTEKKKKEMTYYYILTCFKIDDVLKKIWCFKINDILIFYISFNFIKNSVTNNILLKY